jgi:hypothetical protein
MTTYKSLIPLAAAAAIAGFAGAAGAGTLENLERERAIVIETLLAPNMTAVDRQAKIESYKRRLVDLERMTLRDKKIEGETRPAVRKAFENYDLTFLVHASTEKNATLVDHWLEQVGVSTHTLMSARMGRR